MNELETVQPAKVEIKLENFDTLSKMYHFLILSTIKKIYKMHENNPSVEPEDLYQEGLIALFDSIKNFNPDKKVYFGVYLKVAIKNRLLCYCRNFLPHIYKKDPDKEGKFKRHKINVDSLDDMKSYMF